MTVIIFDTKEGTSYIDKNVYEYIDKNYPVKNWYLANNGYLRIIYKKKNYTIHRLVFEANGIIIPEDKEIDHIDRDKLNNTLENLRIVNRSVNNYNRTKKENTTSKYLGVCWHKGHKKYKASIYIKGKEYFLGYYNNEIFAAYAYDIAKRKLLDNDDSNFNNVDELIDDRTKEKIKNEVLSRIN